MGRWGGWTRREIIEQGGGIDLGDIIERLV